MNKINLLWIFALAIIMPLVAGANICHECCQSETFSCSGTSCECGTNQNLAKVTWSHATNSQEALKKVLADETIRMIEADIIIGLHNPNPNSAPSTAPPTTSAPTTSAPTTSAPTTSKPALLENPINVNEIKDNINVPIMGHPPQTESDLSLEQFLTKIDEHNQNAKPTRGIKLDFKSIDAVERGLDLVKDKKFNTVWINADILKGPGVTTDHQVEPTKFFAAVKKADHLKGSTLSIGWTTEKTDVSYTEDNIDAMIKLLDEQKIKETSHRITFPIRAALAVNSIDVLKKLVDSVAKENKNKVSLTLWSTENDSVDSVKVQKLIDEFTVHKVYVDVPNDLKSKLKLDGGKPNGGSSIAQIGLFNLIALIFAVFMRNSFF